MVEREAPRSTAERHISLPKTFGSGDANEWFKRFDICCRANGWDETTQALKLPTLLEGEALAIWLELTVEQQENYAMAKTEIIKTIMPMGFISLDEFHQRKLRPGEALPVFVYDLKKLLARAMPELDQAAREPLLLHQFLTGLPVAVSRQLRATGETYTLEAAVTRAKLLMTIEDHGQAAAVSKDSAMEQLREQVALLTEQVATLSTSNQAISQPRLRKLPRCFKCNQVGHMQRECPHYTSYRGQAFRRCYTCGKQGHLANNCHQGNGKGMPARGSKYPFQQ